MKKGEMSMQLIVVAVIVLLIAALLIYLVGTNLGLFGESAGACLSRGGTCEDACSGGRQPYYVGDVECKKEQGGGHCCVSGDKLFGDN